MIHQWESGNALLHSQSPGCLVPGQALQLTVLVAQASKTILGVVRQSSSTVVRLDSRTMGVLVLLLSLH